MSFPISNDVVIMTRAELEQREHAAFLRGVERGKFEAIPRRLDNGDIKQGASISHANSEPGSAAPPSLI